MRNFCIIYIYLIPNFPIFLSVSKPKDEMEEARKCDAHGRAWTQAKWDESRRLSFRSYTAGRDKNWKVGSCWAEREDYSKAELASEATVEWNESQQAHGTSESEVAWGSQQDQRQLQLLEQRHASSVYWQGSADEEHISQLSRRRESLISVEDSRQRLQSQISSTCSAQSQAKLSLKKVQVSEIKEEVKANFSRQSWGKMNFWNKFKTVLPFYVEFQVATKCHDKSFLEGYEEMIQWEVTKFDD